jgi:4-aminobutyrate aminotransferase-like enzyme
MPGPSTYFDPSRVGELDSSDGDLIGRRAHVLGSAYRLFYREPINLVRGLGTRVWDAAGTEYLDAYNNVPSVGHSHPRVAEAIAQQAATLTTHTRYLSEPLVRYSEELLATLPHDIDNIMYTCTGSEANDLALRIAKLVTGGTGVIVTTNAYHGVTTEVAAISPSLGGVESVAPWVRLVEPGHLAEGVASALASFAEAGIRPAALIVDTIFASDGVYPEVTDLRDAVAAVRAAGGLFIADEVQPGFGRLGEGMWGVDRYGIVADMVTVGKPMGNGQPIAAVMTRHELVDQFNEHSRYFNTFGGSSVSIAAAQATFDVLRDEDLIESAQLMGHYLKTTLLGMGEFVEVRGVGLFIGAQLESEKRTIEVVNDLRDRHVLVSASGPANDTIKIRPPLPFSTADATMLLTELEAVLR